MNTIELKTKEIDWELYENRVLRTDYIKQNGRVTEIIGLVIESWGPAGSVGDLCMIYPRNGGAPVPAEIVGFRGSENIGDNIKVLLMPLGDMRGISAGSEVVSTGKPYRLGVSDEMLGRVLDGLGNPLDGKSPYKAKDYRVCDRVAPNPFSRKRISKHLATGIKAIDGLLTIGKGQRVGIFSGSGVGKSTLLGMIAKYTEADINVIALIGERGREVREFIEESLGDEGLLRSIVVVSTSDKPALVRINGAMLAMTIAEYFRDQGHNVMFMMDSLTRFSMAQREVGLAVGEPPTTKGYTPSVFALLPRFLERCGTTEHSGSITALVTVLVEADDMNDPIGDAARSILDGHIVLSRNLASRNHYPCIDILESISRVMIEIAPPKHMEAAGKLREVLAVYRDAEDLINLGAYKAGSNQKIDYSIKMINKINDYLCQKVEEHEDFSVIIDKLVALFSGN